VALPVYGEKMFSGIVQGVGHIVERQDLGGDRRWVVAFGDPRIAPLAIGGSISVSGVCLTAVESKGDRFAVDLSRETLDVTTFGKLGVGARVNLEPPLKMGDPLDGHIVTGHVDGVGEVVELAPAARSTTVRIRLPQSLCRYVAQKGSIAVDGVSLTVNDVQGDTFAVNVIPHTQAVTVIGDYRRGVAVNIEVDIIARYVDRLSTNRETSSQPLLDSLKKHGFA
jgi:riboflavin synthase